MKIEGRILKAGKPSKGLIEHAAAQCDFLSSVQLSAVGLGFREPSLQGLRYRHRQAMGMRGSDEARWSSFFLGSSSRLISSHSRFRRQEKRATISEMFEMRPTSNARRLEKSKN